MTDEKKPGKAPQDRQPKAEKPKVDTVEITIGDGDAKRTVKARRVAIRGIVVTVPEENLDDFEVLDDMRALQDNQDPSRMPSLLRRLIGDDFRRVLDALRGENGRVSVEDGTKFVWDLIQALNPNY
ncbi:MULTISPECIES: hypothetical protein [unclassified Microbacterium]|uniref:hypothetical protein n=1 Tax=unclassified Microbacterium TaxID=2609290 RepID=UPI003018B5E8